MPDAVIIDCLRTPVGKAPRGALRNTRPDDLAAIVIRALLERYPQARDDIEDVILGCAMPEGEAGNNMARGALLRAGLPDTVPGMTVNRFCSSGLQAIALAAEENMIILEANGRDDNEPLLRELAANTNLRVQHITTASVGLTDLTVCAQIFRRVQERLIVMTRGIFENDFASTIVATRRVPVLIVEPLENSGNEST